MTDKILVEKTGAVARVTFNQPEKRNAMSVSMWRAFGDALDALAADDGVRALVLAGAGGKAFVSGADISEFDSARSGADAIAAYDALTNDVCGKLEAFPRPVVARIDGYCMGAGLIIASGADFRLAGESASFAIPAAKLGLGFSLANAARIRRLVGPAAARDILFTARRVSAVEAAAMGLATQVVADDAVADAADALAAELAEKAPLTLAAIKAALVALDSEPEARDLDRVAAMVSACGASEDYAEGRKAFMEKRKPAFRGR